MVAREGKLPVPNFSAGGIATPADAALIMQIGAEAVFVGSGIFMKSGVTPLDLKDKAEREEAEARAKAIVIATTHYNDPKVLAEVSEQVPGAMKGLAVSALEEKDLLQTRGW
jgi:pyridoxal 5'-phosphate synthase pdxS subunit